MLHLIITFSLIYRYQAAEEQNEMLSKEKDVIKRKYQDAEQRFVPDCYQDS